MSVRAADLVFFAGGECLTRHGVLVRRSLLAEDVAETFTRSTTGLYVARGGILKVAGVNVPRVNYVDLDGSLAFATPALRLEDQRINGWTRSQEFDHADWTKSNATATANQTTAPDGTGTVDRIVEAAVTDNSHGVIRTPPAMTNDKMQAVTFHTVAGGANERGILRVQTVGKDGAGRDSWFNIGTGAWGTVAPQHTPFVEKIGGGLPGQYRFGVAFDAKSGGSSPSVGVYAALADGSSAAYLGDVTKGFYLWGAQFEADRPFPSSYIPTTTAAVTRATEVFNYAFPHFSLPITVYVDAICRTSPFVGAGTNYELFHIGSSSYFAARLEGDTNRLQTQHDSGAAQFPTSNADAQVAAYGNRIKTRSVLRANGTNVSGISISGGAEIVSSPSGALDMTVFTPATMRVTGGDSSQPGFFDLLALKVAFGEHSLADMESAL